MSQVSEALVRYVNQGVTLGAVNLPEVNLRSLTLDEPNHARVSCKPCTSSVSMVLTVLGDLHTSQCSRCAQER